MIVKHYGYDDTIGHRDDEYFQVEEDCKDSQTGKRYTAFRLIEIGTGRDLSAEIYAFIARDLEEVAKARHKLETAQATMF